MRGGAGVWLLQPVNWKKKFPEADPLAIDLMTKMMAFDPRQRVTVTEALAHPWLAQLHDEAVEPSAPGERDGGGDGTVTRGYSQFGGCFLLVDAAAIESLQPCAHVNRLR